MKKFYLLAAILVFAAAMSAQTTRKTPTGNRSRFETATLPGAGTALDFDGSDDYVSVPDNDALDLTSNYTIEAWIRPAWFPILAGIVSKYQTGSGAGYLLRLPIGGEHRGIDFDGEQTFDYILDANQWYHIAAVNDNGTRRLYVNGVEYTLSTSPITVEANSDFLGIGVDFSSRYFAGEIDEVRVWSAARTAQQIREDMYRSLDGASNLVGYWQMNDGSGSGTLSDASGNHLNGTLTNMDINTAWVSSTVPVGEGSSKSENSFQSGTADLGSVQLTTTDDFDNQVNLVCTRIDNSPNVEPSTSGVNLNDRYWVVTAYDGPPGSFSVNLTFTVPSPYTNDGKEDKSVYTLFGRNDNSDGDWTTVISGAASVMNTAIEFDGITSLSQFMIGSSANDISLSVQATHFQVKSNIGSVTLSWNTQSEVDNAGFNILRQDQGMTLFSVISSYSCNDALKGLGTSSTGRSYDFTDTKARPGATYNYKIQSVSTGGITKDLSTLTVTVDVPKNYALYQNYPNPFNPTTTVRFDLKEQSNVTLDIYNVLGQRMLEENYGTMNAGRFDEVVNMDRFASGVYLYRINAIGIDGQKFTSVKKLMLVK
ncbi:MAG TPA: LamG-like jellyroll fold domain-containing protein [Candidatus Kryptonia bacterium]